MGNHRERTNIIPLFPFVFSLRLNTVSSRNLNQCLSILRLGGFVIELQCVHSVVQNGCVLNSFCVSESNAGG